MVSMKKTQIVISIALITLAIWTLYGATISVMDLNHPPVIHPGAPPIDPTPIDGLMGGIAYGCFFAIIFSAVALVIPVIYRKLKRDDIQDRKAIIYGIVVLANLLLILADYLLFIKNRWS